MLYPLRKENTRLPFGNKTPYSKLNQLFASRQSSEPLLLHYKSDSDSSSSMQSPHESLVRVLKKLEEDGTIRLETVQGVAALDKLDSYWTANSEECGQWQDEYTAFHRAELQKSEPRLAIYECRDEQNCGGLADRVLGMVSTFFFALMTGRAFLMYWDQPTSLESLFDAPSINWTTPQHLKYEPTTINSFNKNKSIVGDIFPNTSWDDLYPQDIVTIRSNRGIIIRSMVNHTLYNKKAFDMGLKLHTATGCFMDYIMRPKRHILRYVNMYLQLLTLPNIFSVGIQIRTGDAAFRHPDTALQLTPEEILARYSPFFDCARDIVETFRHPSQTVVYFFVSDSSQLRNFVLETFPDRVILTSLQPEHIQLHSTPLGNSFTASFDAEGISHLTGSESAIAENWILAGCDYKIVSQGGYGKLAAYHGKRVQSTILLTPRGNNAFLKRLPVKYEEKCSNEKAFSSFPEMADQWSLG
jgi:hypothetical protein